MVLHVLLTYKLTLPVLSRTVSLPSTPGPRGPTDRGVISEGDGIVNRKTADIRIVVESLSLLWTSLVRRTFEIQRDLYCLASLSEFVKVGSVSSSRGRCRPE